MPNSGRLRVEKGGVGVAAFVSSLVCVVFAAVLQINYNHALYIRFRAVVVFAWLFYGCVSPTEMRSCS